MQNFVEGEGKPDVKRARGSPGTAQGPLSLRGLERFEPHNVLELLLFYSVPRRDTNVLAHRLLEHFGSLVGVLSAAPEQLAQVEGIGMNAAVHLHLVADIARRYYA